ncbi:MAG: hypothetical protein PVJ57_03115 [Phycisphaerae bacterium]|jgi:hypothetical protein
MTSGTGVTGEDQPLIEPLEYASVHRRRGRLWRRVLCWCAGLTVIGVTCGLGAWVWRGIRTLDGRPGIGPLDSGAILTSPTLLRLAIQLWWDEKLTRKLSLYYPFPQSCGTSLWSDNLASTSVRLETPVTYADSYIHLRLVVTNHGDAPVVIPPLRFPPRAVSYWDPLRFGDPPEVWLEVAPGPLLGTGVRVVGAGEATTLDVEAYAAERPSKGMIHISASGWFHGFAVRIGAPAAPGTPGVRLPYASWSDVPASEFVVLLGGQPVSPQPAQPETTPPKTGAAP